MKIIFYKIKECPKEICKKEIETFSVGGVDISSHIFIVILLSKHFLAHVLKGYQKKILVILDAH